MAFEINKFLSSVNRTGGLAKSSDFMVDISIPKALLNKSAAMGIDNGQLAFRISSAGFPQRSVNPIEYSTYGPLNRIGGTANYLEFAITVLLSNDFREREFFLSWQDLIVGNSRKNDGNNYDYDIGYFDDYKSIIEVSQLDPSTGEAVYKVKLHDVFPNIVSEATSSWDNQELQTMNCTFQYHHFTDEFTFGGNKRGERPPTIFERINQSGLGGGLSTIGGVIAGRIF
jgi:hypothetical protein